jgi:phosphoglycolate phosphatase-like HAD superfamily hydrolase
MSAYHSAVIFDIDGPLLDLTPPEEQAFFAPFEHLHGITGLSNDWDSYRIRNDENIIEEILERHFGRSPHGHEMDALKEKYAQILEAGYVEGTLKVAAIPGARDLLQFLSGAGGIALGTATANILHAARTRLAEAGMWDYVSTFPGAADGGGAKRDVLARVIDQLDVPRERIVFLGDNLNDLDAGVSNGVHFIGFHVDEPRRQRLRDHGAETVFGSHDQTRSYIIDLLEL